jgi:hypothetical protein
MDYHGHRVSNPIDSSARRIVHVATDVPCSETARKSNRRGMKFVEDKQRKFRKWDAARFRIMYPTFNAVVDSYINAHYSLASRATRTQRFGMSARGLPNGSRMTEYIVDVDRCFNEALGHDEILWGKLTIFLRELAGFPAEEVPERDKIAIARKCEERFIQRRIEPALYFKRTQWQAA